MPGLCRRWCWRSPMQSSQRRDPKCSRSRRDHSPKASATAAGAGATAGWPNARGGVAAGRDATGGAGATA